MLRYIAVLVPVLLAATPAMADFCLLTQNGLHVGRGEVEARRIKRDGFRGVFRDYDAVAVQEVMEAEEAQHLAPEGYQVSLSAAKGRGGYREHYAILTRRAALTVLAAVDYPDADDAFSRPPFGVAVAESDGTRTWLVDFHAVFGRNGVAPRRQEVAAMIEVLAFYAAYRLPDGGAIGRVVVVGDWNLPADDEAFDGLRAAERGIEAAPNLRSTLNAQGRFASAYDHFVWNRTRVGVSFAAEPRDWGGLPTEDFRTQLSDHVGVAGYVSRPGGGMPRDAACPPARVGS